ncbi:TSUP family transporter [Marinospirillum perlucidum]|uniref:TSUP family transporter n=1 Tax=Marinospirillum perlucidum TaxID=1982602 RepID=UPI000DF328C2|nr:TSUP family transporter [Marinospirillum perlucidum]
MELSLEILSWLFVAALVAGFIDTLAGGGGLITIPALLLAGVAPLEALATNKLQSVFGVATASATLFRRRLLVWQEMRALFFAALAGSALGAASVQLINPQMLDWVIPLVLLLIAAYYLLAPKAGDLETRPRIRALTYQRFWVPVIGFYDGMFGPGTGSFFATSAVALRGYTLLDATVRAKFLNLATNLAALAVFALGGELVWSIGLVMLVGQALGAWLGTQAVLKGGSRLIRPLLVTTCVLMLIRYFWTG